LSLMLAILVWSLELLMFLLKPLIFSNTINNSKQLLSCEYPLDINWPKKKKNE
jgi:hypothetical protein